MEFHLLLKIVFEAGNLQRCQFVNVENVLQRICHARSNSTEETAQIKIIPLTLD